MADEIILFVTAILAAILFNWAFKNLPDEKWQFFASYPVKKNENGTWEGINFTFYGFFSATGYATGTLFYVFMMFSINMNISNMLFPAVIILGICMPAASLIARIVEKKKYTLTIGGASFLGITCAPWIISSLNLVSNFYHLDFHIPVWPTLAALAASYCLGESIGRLGCISFGCCYGRPVSKISGYFTSVIDRFAFVYFGKTKKIAYASGLDGQKVIPVQAFSAIILFLSFMAGMYLFLKELYTASILVSLGISQIWRAYSETLRADYRGNSKISAYQKMAFISVCYITILIISGLWPQDRCISNAYQGIRIIWETPVILFIQLIWIVSFLYSGKSKVTSVAIKYSVTSDNI